MPSPKQPTIKGMFVQAHVEKLRSAKGDKAVAALEQSLGRQAYFKRLDDVPVKDEVTIIELAYDLLNEGHGLVGSARDRAVGRLHFQNFIGTTFGSTVMNSMPHTAASFQTILYSIGPVARSVIKHTEFKAAHMHGGVCVTLRNNDYPPEHFAGFFEAWMAEWQLVGHVVCTIKGPRVHEYAIIM